MRSKVSVTQIMEYLKIEIELLNAMENAGRYDSDEGLSQYGRDRRNVLYDLYYQINSERIELETKESKRRLSSYR